MKAIIIASFVTVLTACASLAPAKVDEHFSSWKGRSINDFSLRFGAPGAERQVDTKHIAEWTKQKTSSSPSLSIGVGGFSGNVGGSIGTSLFGGNKLDSCTVQVFYGNDGIIENINWSGDTDLCVKSFPVQ